MRVLSSKYNITFSIATNFSISKLRSWGSDLLHKNFPPRFLHHFLRESIFLRSWLHYWLFSLFMKYSVFYDFCMIVIKLYHFRETANNPAQFYVNLKNEIALGGSTMFEWWKLSLWVKLSTRHLARLPCAVGQNTRFLDFK